MVTRTLIENDDWARTIAQDQNDLIGILHSWKETLHNELSYLSNSALCLKSPGLPQHEPKKASSSSLATLHQERWLTCRKDEYRSSSCSQPLLWDSSVDKPVPSYHTRRVLTMLHARRVSLLPPQCGSHAPLTPTQSSIHHCHQTCRPSSCFLCRSHKQNFEAVKRIFRAAASPEQNPPSNRRCLEQHTRANRTGGLSTGSGPSFGRNNN